MGTAHGTWNGEYGCDIDFDGTKNYYEIHGRVSATHYHDDGCFYRRNGDPGDPPYDETEIDEVEEIEVFCDDKLVTDPTIIELAKNRLCDYLYDNEDEFEWGSDGYDDCDPDEDDYDWEQDDYPSDYYEDNNDVED